MHDLVHDLAISLLGDKLLYKRKQENTMGKSKDCQYALLGNCSESLRLTRPAQLIALRFFDCRSTKLYGAAFAPAASLRVLDLSECSIDILPDCIRQLNQLRYLKAPGVGDRTFPICITKLSHLIFLNLQGSDIENIPESIGEIKDLMHLDLSGCRRIRGLPGSFMNLEKLVHLDFSNSPMILRETESVWSLSRLEHLSLSGCLIAGELAKAPCGLTELQYLDLSSVFSFGNICKGLQQVFVRSTKLRYLDLCRVLDCSRVGRAEIETFIDAISRLSSLEYLNLSRNGRLHNIPESFGNLSKLHTLDLSYCFNLERLPASISGIDNMKCILVAGCDRLDKSSLALYKNVAMFLPYFMVHAGDSESSSNLCQLEYENPTNLEMSGLENVKSTGEAQRIKLVEKQRIEVLGLVWTREAKRFVADEDVLKELVPPYTVGQIGLQGYNSAGFPSWMMDIATYLPHIIDVTLEDMPNCSSLPPLGQLPNLQKLRIGRMDNIKKIDLYGDGGFKNRAFPQLVSFYLQEMKCLEEWDTSCSYPNSSKDLAFPKLQELVMTDCPVLRLEFLSPLGRNYKTILHNDQVIPSSSKELAFPNLEDLVIADCPMLRFESLPPLAPVGRTMIIIRSGQFIPSSWVWTAEFHAVTSSAATTCLSVMGCEAPLHQWSLLRHLPCIKELRIEYCSDLTCSSTDLFQCLPSLEKLYVKECKGIAALPERLGDLTSLKTLEVSNCPCVMVLPESIQQLTRLELLQIDSCPQLVQLRCPSSLKTLFVRDCESIAALPERLGDLTSLDTLEIRGCQGIKALPESIQQLTRLQLLQIDNCPQLVQLRCPSSLETLFVSDCKSIVALPERLGDLTYLKTLEIRSCHRIMSLPESIQQLTCLQCLTIYGCPNLELWLEENKTKLAHIKEKRVLTWNEAFKRDMDKDWDIFEDLAMDWSASD